MHRLFKHEQGVILVGKENVPKKLVIFWTPVVGLLILSVWIIYLGFVLFVMLLFYFCCLLLLPVMCYMKGLKERIRSNLIFWILVWVATERAIKMWHSGQEIKLIRPFCEK